MAGFESLGQLLAGSPGIAEGEGFLEGLNTGSLIRARQASTESALQLARQRRDENIAKQKLSELFADDPELAALFQADIDPTQLSRFREDVQSMGFRKTVADPSRPFGERQASAQAISGKPLPISDFLGPGGELFGDIFAEPSLENLQVTPTGRAQIQADTALAGEREGKRLSAEQIDELRAVVSDPSRPFGERQAAAQAIEGKTLAAGDFLGPGGELFMDIFGEPTAEGLEVTPTGEAQIELDRARAALAREKRLFPDRFKSTKLSLGDELSESLLPGGQGETIVPDTLNAEEAFGAEAFFTGAANAFTDFIGLGVKFPEAAQAQTVLSELSARTQIILRNDVPGARPPVMVQELLARYAEDPRQLFRGDDLAVANLTTTLASLKRSLKRTKTMLDSKANKTPTRLGRLEDSLFSFADLVADYEAILASIERAGPKPKVESEIVEIADAQIGDRIQLPGGGTATRIE